MVPAIAGAVALVGIFVVLGVVWWREAPNAGAFWTAVLFLGVLLVLGPGPWPLRRRRPWADDGPAPPLGGARARLPIGRGLGPIVRLPPRDAFGPDDRVHDPATHRTGPQGTVLHARPVPAAATLVKWPRTGRSGCSR